MKKKNLLVTLTLGLLVCMLVVQPASAKAPTPSQAEASIVLTYYSPYNTDYKIADPLITDYTVDLMFLEGIRDDTVLSLGCSVWESNLAVITANAEYSDTMGNNTWDAGTVDGMTINTEAACNSAETLITFKATNNGSSVAQYAQTYSYFAWDSNDDGDYVDSADKGHLPHDENVWITVNNEMTIEGTDAQSYSLVDVVLETTSGTDYTISIKYWYTAGDSGWDFSTGNGATLEFFDCSGIPIVTTLPIADILDADSGEAVNVIGTDYYRQYLYQDVASEYIQNELKNIAYFTSMPAATDNSDGNNNWDFDSTDEYFTGIDQTDYLYTVVTQDSTDTYDSDQELLADWSDVITTKVKARYLYFTGTMAMYPSPHSYGSQSTTTPAKYLTTETLQFDTREINDLTSLANVLAWSTWQFNVTLEDTNCMWDCDHYENNLYDFSWDGIDETENFRASWTTSTDDSEVQYDCTDPSTTTGSRQDVIMKYFTGVNFEDVEEEVETTTTTAANGEIIEDEEAPDITIGVILVLLCVGATILYFKKRK